MSIAPIGGPSDHTIVCENVQSLASLFCILAAKHPMNGIRIYFRENKEEIYEPNSGNRVPRLVIAYKTLPISLRMSELSTGGHEASMLSRSQISVSTAQVQQG